MTAELLGQRQNPSLAAKESRHLAEQIHFQLGRSASPNMEPGRKMWEQITKADLERAKTQLSLKRAETLRRHAEEIAELDAQLQDIERFDGIVAAFFEEHMSPEEPAAVSNEQSSATPVNLQIRQHVSPSFATPPRRRTSAGS
jgi:hypothetical protein